MVNMLFTTFGIISPMAYNIFVLLAVVVFFGVYIPWDEKRKKSGGKTSTKCTGKVFRAERRNRSTKLSKPAFRPESPDHEHISISGQDTKARLEQLEVLKNAGLLTEKEYMEKRKETLKEL